MSFAGDPAEAPTTLAAQVAHRLADRIVRADIRGGAVLTEVQVAAEEGVSRTPVREAMLQLDRWGLVRLLPKKGAVVVAPSAREVADLLDLRRLLEVAALDAALADDDRRTRLLDGLARSLTAQRAALDAGDVAAFSGCDVGFHLAVIRAGENVVVDEVMRSLAPRLALLIHDVSRDDAAAAATFYADHEEIVRAVQAGDAERARRAVVTHTSGARHRRLGT